MFVRCTLIDGMNKVLTTKEGAEKSSNQAVREIATRFQKSRSKLDTRRNPEPRLKERHIEDGRHQETRREREGWARGGVLSRPDLRPH